MLKVLLLFMAATAQLSLSQIRFPKDEGRHPDAKIEMWNIYGHLRDDSGAQIGIMASFFTGKYLFIRGNATIIVFTDEKQKTHLSDYEFFLPLFSSVEHTEEKLAEQYGESFLTKTADGIYKLSLAVGGYEVKLDFVSEKETMFSKKNSAQPSGNNTSGYLLPRLEAKGNINTGDGTSKKVVGSVSFDHRWSASMEEDHDVFILQLSDTTDLYLFFRHAENGQGPLSGSFVNIAYVDNQHVDLSEYKVDILGWWTKPGTTRKYPKGWLLTIPSQNISLTLQPTFFDQEISMMGVTSWAGTVSVNGKVAEKNVTGKGWAALHGYK
ncbi:MAG: lipocalin family protein [Bacteroidota bacterium]